MSARTLEPAVAPRRPWQRRLPRVLMNVPEFFAFLAEKGIDSPAKVAREFEVAESVISRLQATGGQTSIHFLGLVWAKYPEEPMDRFLLIPGRDSAKAA